ncbi:MAG: hypothetical protein KGJ86_23085, partial [Chloroflexota bacterium]|nr:hypothetical protein [Chloroflexota bacterium]
MERGKITVGKTSVRFSRRQILGMLTAGAVGVLAACGGATSVSTSASVAASPSSAASKPSSAAASAPASGSSAAPSAASSSAVASTSTSAAAGGSASPALQTLVDGAKKEGQVVVYGIPDPSILQRLQADFKNKFGVTMNFQRLVDAQLAQRYAAEADANNVQADVVIVGNPLFADETVSKGWIAKIESLPALSSWPKDYWNGSY